MIRLLLILPLFLVGCATQPKTYLPPSNAKLNTSTGKLSKEVESAHVSAKKAQKDVSQASTLVKHAKAEVAKIKNVPLAVTQEINDLQTQLDQAQKDQSELEQHLAEADQARAQVEKDKADYYEQAQKLADAATTERNDRIKAEGRLHWYRVHWILTWGLFALGLILSVVFFVAKFAGKLPFP